MSSAYKYHICILILLTAFIVIAYSNTLDSSFQFDDNGRILENPAVRDPGNLKAIWKYSNRRFIGYLTFAINYKYGKDNVFGYHLINLLLHLATSISTFYLVLLFLQFPKTADYIPDKIKIILAGGTALIFGCHPLQTQTVTYIIQRFTILSALCLILVIIFYIKFRQHQEKGERFLSNPAIVLYASALVTALIGTQTKETFIVLPLILVIMELYLFNNNNKMRVARVVQILPFAMIVSIIPYFRSQATNTFVEIFTHTFKVTRWEYLMTQFHVLTKYLRLFIWPAGQNLDYDIAVAESFFEPRIYLSFCLLSSLALSGILLFKKQKLISFGIFWFFITLSPQSSLVPIQDLIFEHRTYPGIFGLSLALVFGLFIRAGKRSIKTMVAVLLSIILALTFVTYNRNKVWHDRVSLWSDTVKKSPSKARPHINLGNALADIGRNEEALRHLETAISISPNNLYALNNKGRVLLEIGRIDDAIVYLEKALILNPDYAEAHYNLGNAYSRNEDYTDAAIHYNKAISIKPHFSKAHYNLGNTGLHLGLYEESIRNYENALKFDPGNAETIKNLAIAHSLQGNTEKAISHYREALKIKPGWPESSNNLAWILATDRHETLRNGPEAVRLAETACEATGYEKAIYLDTLGAAYAENGQYDKAIEAALKASEAAQKKENLLLRNDINMRISYYRKNQPYRE